MFRHVTSRKIFRPLTSSYRQFGRKIPNLPHQKISSESLTKLQCISGSLFFTACTYLNISAQMNHENYSFLEFLFLTVASAGISVGYGVLAPITVPITLLFGVMEITRN